MMKPLPETENPLVLRTDFSDEDSWEAICATIREPVGDFGFLANVEYIDDVEYKNATTEQLLEHVPSNYPHTFIIVADRIALSQSDHPLLIIDLMDEPGRVFRAIPSEIQGIENNLSISNMGFEEFAEAVDKNGIFRGFPGM